MAATPTRIRWTADQIEGVRGRHYVVTGGNSGLGKEIVGELARHQAGVTLACRDVAKGQSARAELVERFGPLEIDVKALDLASLASVRDFASALASAPIDGLVNNAGIMAVPKARTADGFESQLGVNHLGHFALTGLLWDGLQRAEAATVVTMSSNAHKPGRLDLDDLNFEQRRYSRFAAYAQSKLANLLFAFELQRRAGSATFRSVAAHPGYSATNLSGGAMPGVPWLRRAFRSAEAAIAQPAWQGALPALYALAAREVPGGAYAGPDGWQEWRGYPRLVTPIPAARDAEDARLLWQLSENLTGVRWL